MTVAKQNDRLGRGVAFLIGSGIGLIVAFILATVLVVPGPVINTSAIIEQRVAFTTIGQRELMVFSYADRGSGGLASLGRKTHRIAALDTASGEIIWDTGLPKEVYSGDVLAAGQRYAYLAATWGLAIIDLTNGKTVLHDEEIGGVEEDPPFSQDFTFATDPGGIVTESSDGQIMFLPLDGREFSPADGAVADRWGCLVGAGKLPLSLDNDRTLDQGVGRDDGGYLRIGPAPGSPAGLPSKSVIESSPSGEHALGNGRYFDQEFDPAAFVGEDVPLAPLPGACRTAKSSDELFEGGHAETHHTFGLESGWMLVEGGRSVTDRRGRLSVVDAASGELLDRAEAEQGADVVITSPRGRHIVLAGTALRHKFSLRKLGPYTSIFYLISKDGLITEVRVAEHGWFGF